MLIRMDIRNDSTKNNNKEFERYLIHLTASWSLFSDQEHCWTEGDGCQWTRDTPHLCSTTGGGVWGGRTTPYTKDSGEWVRGGKTTPHTEDNGKWALRLAGMYGVGELRHIQKTVVSEYRLGKYATYQGQFWVSMGWGKYAIYQGQWWVYGVGDLRHIRSTVVITKDNGEWATRMAGMYW